ncbi:MAG: cytochrome-c peroxidase [Bacteroidia bacterium]|nr:cytochrome-c peroxidase [Bacteroidia bacterium]
MKAKIGILFLALACISLKGNWHIPSYFPKPLQALPQNKHQVFLGRKLFYDPLLSENNSISCSSCHSPYNGFAHTDHALSHGIDDQIGNRNAPALFNLAWQSLFMWDGAINRLDAQVLAPIHNPREMGSSINRVISKLQTSSSYPLLFKKAFGDTAITSHRIITAIAQFELGLVSFHSKYDSVRLGKAQFSSPEKRGYNLFLKHCNACHTEPLFTSGKLANNGLPVLELLQDYGRYSITKIPSDSLFFKIPSLRNLRYTYPYMHDGRFSQLNNVLRHYQELSTSTHPKAKAIMPEPISNNDKADIIAFLQCLDDRKFIFNPQNLYPKEEKP